MTFQKKELCIYCNQEEVKNLTEEDLEAHNSTGTHIFNQKLYEWNKYKSILIQDKNDVYVEIWPKSDESKIIQAFETNEELGTSKIKVTPLEFQNINNVLTFDITIINSGEENVVITGYDFLHPINWFSCVGEIIDDGLYPELEPGAQYTFQVKFTQFPCIVGRIQNTISINFQMADDELASFTIARSIIIVINNKIEEVVYEKSPFTGQGWSKSGEKIHIVPPTYRTYEKRYAIPKNDYRVLSKGLDRIPPNADESYIQCLANIKEYMDSREVTLENYREYLKILLYMEEIGQMVMLRRYNMENVIVRVTGNDIIINIPGLAEKRPSIIKGDSIEVRIHNDHTGYCGQVRSVADKSVCLKGVDSIFVNYLRAYPGMGVDVRFKLGRLSIERQHDAIIRTVETGLVQKLFPVATDEEVNSKRSFEIRNENFINKNIVTNNEQRIAINNIMYRPRNANHPYIVFGPPGTGKTVTIVEAILQLKKTTGASILVCAPSNSVCNAITLKLMEHSSKQELIRVHSNSVDVTLVDDSVLKYSNYEFGTFYPVGAGKLKNYRIVITTLCLIGRYENQLKFDYVFVDEAAQASESETTIAASCAQTAGGIVLAGDPKQLGPICHSSLSENYGYSQSLLERLMNLEFYKRSNPYYIQMLKNNFRSHPLILDIPNKLFYDKQLKACSPTALSDIIANVVLLPNHRLSTGGYPGQPIEFFGVFSDERREGASPSYYNPAEIQIVLEYVQALLKINGVRQMDIGIVTPYIKQVYKLKEKIYSSGYRDIEVGSTENFQGREKRIIIISTVRAADTLLGFDRQYNLGFVRNPKRFNVAMTRAKSKLIVIGCPQVLATDKKWLQYIELCEKNHSYYGAPFIKRTGELMDNITQKMTNISLKDHERVVIKASAT